MSHGRRRCHHRPRRAGAAGGAPSPPRARDLGRLDPEHTDAVLVPAGPSVFPSVSREDGVLLGRIRHLTQGPLVDLRAYLEPHARIAHEVLVPEPVAGKLDPWVVAGAHIETATVRRTEYGHGMRQAVPRVCLDKDRLVLVGEGPIRDRR